VIIEGYTHRDGTPFVDVLLELPALKIKRKISFLIDTGSPVTILSERDARKLKLDYEKLSSANGNIMGLGGFSETYMLRKVILHFFTRKESLDIQLDDLYVSKSIIADEEIINQIPSLLGRDALKEFTFIYNENQRSVSLKKAGTRRKR
jgi:hypothetical protein